MYASKKCYLAVEPSKCMTDSASVLNWLSTGCHLLVTIANFFLQNTGFKFETIHFRYIHALKPKYHIAQTK